MILGKHLLAFSSRCGHWKLPCQRILDPSTVSQAPCEQNLPLACRQMDSELSLTKYSQKSDNHLKGLLPFCKQAGKLSSPANFFYREAILVSESVLGHQAYSALCWHIRATKIRWCSKHNHLVEPISWEKGVCLSKNLLVKCHMYSFPETKQRTVAYVNILNQEVCF